MDLHVVIIHTYKKLTKELFFNSGYSFNIVLNGGHSDRIHSVRFSYVRNIRSFNIWTFGFGLAISSIRSFLFRVRDSLSSDEGGSGGYTCLSILIVFLFFEGLG